MTYEIYRYIFIGAAVLSGIMLLVSVLLFVILKIPQVVGDLSGATARKAIQSIREQTESAADGDGGQPLRHKNLTDKISPSGHLLHHNSGALATGMMTAKISTQELAGGEETTVLSADETVLLSPDVNNGFSKKENDVAVMFVIAKEITYLHSEEWADI